MYSRFARKKIEEALSDTRVVLISGPRQSGKTTLAMDVAGGKMPFLTLDDANVLRSAVDEPVGFVRDLDRSVIDEVRRARTCCSRSRPESMLTKRLVAFC